MIYNMLQMKAYIHSPDLSFRWYIHYAHGVFEPVTEGNSSLFYCYVFETGIAYALTVNVTFYAVMRIPVC